jgi:Flp pilus assembly protein TadD
MNNGNYAEAERNYTGALKLFPNSKIAREGLNKARSHQGRKD